MSQHPLIEQAIQAGHPVARSLAAGSHFKVLLLAFGPGQLMKEHRTKLPARLVVLQGAVVYQQGETVKHLNPECDTEIPVDIPHHVTSEQPALCLLIQG